LGPGRGGRWGCVVCAPRHTVPGSGWQLLAAAGRDGRDGATGPRGEPAPTITGWRVDRAAYSAVPLLSDGSEGAPLELRGLFKQFLDELAPRARQLCRPRCGKRIVKHR